MADDIPTRKQRKKQVHPNARGPKHTAEQVEIAHKQTQALRLRLAGASYRAIATQMGTGPASVYRWIQEAISSIPRETAKDLLSLEIAKADEDELRLNQQLTDSKKPLTTRALCKLLETKIKIRDQRARYTGLYAPEKHQHSGLLAQVNLSTVRGMSDEQLRRIAAGDFSSITGAAGSDSSGARGAGAPSPLRPSGEGGSAH